MVNVEDTGYQTTFHMRNYKMSHNVQKGYRVILINFKLMMR